MSKSLQKTVSFVLVLCLTLMVVCTNMKDTSIVKAETKYSVANAFQNAQGVKENGFKYDFNSDSNGTNLVSGNTGFKDKISTAVGNSDSTMTVTSSKTARFEGFTQFYTNNRWACASTMSFDLKMASSSEDFSGFYIKYGNEIPSAASKNIVFYSNDGVRGDSANSTTGTTGIGFSFRTIGGRTCIEIFVKYLDSKGKLCVSSQFFYDAVSNLYAFNTYKITDDNKGNISMYINDELFVSFVCSDLKVPTASTIYKERYYSTVKIIDKNKTTLATVSNALVSGESALAFGTRNEILELDNLEILDTGENLLGVDGVSVSVSNSFSITYVVIRNKFDEGGYKNPVLKVEFSGKTYEIPYVTQSIGGIACYVFTFDDIAPQMMSDTMTATLLATKDGVTCESTPKEYSIAEYVYTQLNTTTSPKTRRMLVDMLKYGAASQSFTNYKNSEPVDANLTETQFSWGTQELRELVNSASAPSSDGEVTWIGMGLNVENKVSILGWFEAPSTDGLFVKVTNAHHNVISTISASEFSSVTGPNGTPVTLFEFDDLSVAQMSDVVGFTVCNEQGEDISGTYKYSIESYVQQYQSSSNAAFVELLNAMMIFGDSAYNYVNTVEDSDDNNSSSELQGPLVRQEYIQHLEEKYANYMEVPYGLDITKKTDLVSIFYSTWFNVSLGDKTNPPNITNILEEGKRTGVYNWGAAGEFHYWAEPALGYYRSDNKQVIRTHMTQLADAGVDFIIVDQTYMNKDRTISEWEWELFITEPCTALLDTIVEMRAEGLKTPYVVFWSGSFSETGWAVVERLYRDVYSVQKWKDCFVYWEGNLFQLLTRTPSTPMSGMNLTVREMWGLEQNLGAEKWSFLQHLNEPIKSYDGYTEQMCVCTAAQRDYMSNAATAQGREHGIFMYSQWYHAFKERPKVVSITWWNEWTAQRIPMSDGKTYHFTDNYNQEYSRDIEPMKGGHGDQYYLWMKEYIRSYRALEDCPVLVESGYETQAKQVAQNKYGS